ncbi:MAG TPA: hypothetical protein VGF16_01270 [Bryobacteraceae bacterium]
MASLGAELVFWIVLPALVAIGAAYLVWLLMQARIQVLAARYQTAVAKVEGECCSRRPSADDLLTEFRIERRRFLRRIPGPKGNETTLITQERLYLRNLPLTSWMQEEVPLGTGEELPAETSIIPLVEPPATQSLTVPLPVSN